MLSEPSGILTPSTQFIFKPKPDHTFTIPPQFNETVTRIMKAIATTLSQQSPSPYTQVHGVLVQGTPGSGKTAVLKEIARQHPHSVYLSADAFYLTDPSTLIQSNEFVFEMSCH